MGSLYALTRILDGLNHKIGIAVAWLAVLMVLTQFVVVVLRYVFGVNSILMQESVIYMHSFIFLLGAGYTLLKNGHVRVDVFYRALEPRKKAYIDIFGVLCLLLPFCYLISTASWKYVLQSWSIWEGSIETSGIQALYVLKTSILVFAGLLALQGVALLCRSLLVLKGVYVETPEPGELEEGMM